MNDILQEKFRNTSDLPVDESRDTFQSTMTDKTKNSWFGDTFVVVKKYFSMTFSTYFFQSLSSFSPSSVSRRRSALNKTVFTSTFYVHFVYAYPYLPGTTLASLYRPISDRDFGAIQPLSITLQILRVTLSVYQGPQVRFFGQKIDDSQWLNKVEKSLTNMQYVFSFIWFIGNLSHWFYYKSDKKMMKAS